MAEGENNAQATEKMVGGVTGKGFKPGQSGNPKGRPPLAKDFKQRCRDFMQAEGWRTLQELAQDPKSAHRFRALELIANYGYGKPTQLIGADDENPLKIVVDLL